MENKSEEIGRRNANMDNNSKTNAAKMLQSSQGYNLKKIVENY